MKIVVDVPDSAKNRQWMKQFKARWKERLEQLDLWMVSYRIEVEQERVRRVIPIMRRITTTLAAAPAIAWRSS